MKYAALILPGPHWVPGQPISEQPQFPEHVRYMEAQFQAGTLVIGGPYADATGGLAILEVADEAQAWSVVNGSPAVAGGVFKVDMRRWAVLLDRTVPPQP